MDVHIPPLLMDLFDETHPDCGTSSQAKASAIRDDLRVLWRTRKLATTIISQQPDLIPFETVPAKLNPREIADKIATQAPRIDDQNWQAIKRGVEIAEARGLWDHPEIEQQLIDRLTVDFDGAMNEYRVQKSRITAFFERLCG